MKTYTEDSFVDADSLPALEPILNRWLDVQRKYAAAVGPNDGPPWCYKERPCIGFLSAAAWMCGGVTLEEWGIDKQKHVDATARGRSDLWIGHNKNQFFIEAKHMEVRRYRNHDWEVPEIRRKLNDAVIDASAVVWETASEKLGVLFVVPSYHPDGHSENPADFDADITEWLQRVDTGVEHSAMAWLFPPRNHIQAYKDEPSAAGILLLARTPKCFSETNEGENMFTITEEHRRWATARQRGLGGNIDDYLALIREQDGKCAFSGVPLIFDREHGGGFVRGQPPPHPLYAALDHCAPGNPAHGFQIVCFALNDLKGHLPLDCFRELARTACWRRLMEAWRNQQQLDVTDREAFRTLLRQPDAIAQP